MTKKILLTLVLFWVFVFPVAATSVKNDLMIDDAWIRLGPSIVKVYAGYFTIINKSPNESFQLLGVESDLFEKVEMHNTSIIDGMMRMEHLRHVDIPPNAKVEFSTSGKHLMMINKKKPIQEGDVIPVTLLFSHNQSVDISMPVRR